MISWATTRVVSSSYHSVIRMARKDLLDGTTKGREVPPTDVVSMMFLNPRPEGLRQRTYHEHGVSTPGSEAKGAFTSYTTGVNNRKGVSNPSDAGNADCHTLRPGGTSNSLVP